MKYPLFILATLAAASMICVAPNGAFAEDQAACVKREIAKGRTACIAKVKCEGVTSRKEQARRCNG